jgi:hypothetical protein
LTKLCLLQYHKIGSFHSIGVYMRYTIRTTVYLYVTITTKRQHLCRFIYTCGLTTLSIAQNIQRRMMDD